MTLLRINNDDGQYYEIRQNSNDYIEVTDGRTIWYLKPDTLLELVKEHNDGVQS